jgi:hypothetical protein
MGLFRASVESFLPDRDYLPVAMPTTGVHTLQVLTRQGPALRRYSELAEVLAIPPGTDQPAVHRDERVVDTSGTMRRQVKLGIGLGVVSALVRALGADASVDLSSASANSVEYGYEEVAEDWVDLASLDSWLSGADFRPGLRNITDLLAAEAVYVIVGALKASAVSVSLLDSNSNGVKVNVPAIQAAVGAKVSVTAGASRSHHLTFHGSTPLTVAAKAAQLKFDENGFWINERLASNVEIRGIPGEDEDSGVSYLAGRELLLG